MTTGVIDDRGLEYAEDLVHEARLRGDDRADRALAALSTARNFTKDRQYDPKVTPFQRAYCDALDRFLRAPYGERREIAREMATLVELIRFEAEERQRSGNGNSRRRRRIRPA